MNALCEFCREHEGVLLEADMRPENAIDCLLNLLAMLEEREMNPCVPDSMNGDPQTVAYFADWIDGLHAENLWHPLDNLWSYINEIIAIEGFEVATHPDDPACIGLWEL